MNALIQQGRKCQFTWSVSSNMEVRAGPRASSRFQPPWAPSLPKSLFLFRRNIPCSALLPRAGGMCWCSFSESFVGSCALMSGQLDRTRAAHSTFQGSLSRPQAAGLFLTACCLPGRVRAHPRDFKRPLCLPGGVAETPF